MQMHAAGGTDKKEGKKEARATMLAGREWQPRSHGENKTRRIWLFLLLAAASQVG